ncbi:MAG: CoA pyrophosphatase [Pseudomonadota bacterium]
MLEQLIARLRSHQLPPVDPVQTEASVLVPVTALDRRPELILTRRALTMNSHAGEVAFPGGKKDAADADLLVTALRESEEEIGLPRAEVDVVGRLTTLTARSGIRVVPWVGVVSPAIELTASPHELDAIFRVPLSFFLETPMQSDHAVRWQGHEYLMPTWRYDGHMIWGLTAYIIVDLLNTAYDAGLVVPPPTARRDAG